MSRPTPKAFAQLLQNAVHEPGILSQAYRQFHSYSLGNQLLAWAQCQERGLEPGPMATYPRWKELGRQVRKGSRRERPYPPLPIPRTARSPGSAEPQRRGRRVRSRQPC